MRRGDDQNMPESPVPSSDYGPGMPAVIAATVGICAVLAGVALAFDLGRKPRQRPFLGYDR